MKIYLAHPISGLSYEEVEAYYRRSETWLRTLSCAIEIMNPMSNKEHLRTDTALKKHGNGHPVSCNHHIVERDLWMVRRADLVYIDLTGTQNVSIGCVSELAVAHTHGVYTVVAMEPGNIHEHAFVLEMADLVLPSAREAEGYLDDFLRKMLS